MRASVRLTGASVRRSRPPNAAAFARPPLTKPKSAATKPDKPAAMARTNQPKYTSAKRWRLNASLTRWRSHEHASPVRAANHALSACPVGDARRLGPDGRAGRGHVRPGDSMNISDRVWELE